MWGFDFTCSWNGTSKTEAEKNQLNIDPVFEIELELIKANEYLQKKSTKHLVVSMLLKVQDLIGNIPIQTVRCS